MNRAGQRCFELSALIGSPQLSFSKVFPAEQTSWPNWQSLRACTEADGLVGNERFFTCGTLETCEKSLDPCSKDSHRLSLLQGLPSA